MYETCIAQTRVPQLGCEKVTRDILSTIWPQVRKNINFVCVSQHKENISMFWFRDMTHSVHQQH